jgi:hypothetical protein
MSSALVLNHIASVLPVDVFTQFLSSEFLSCAH